ncbi:MAG TPA: flagellar hook protein FlgE [Amnibacterium sp.]|jgi:flagellar hook protein FlgE|uniref:flagellar hook protein FlgE n=1 Tax=Amnibacterium sp. TaxID=1872496 RepID=UPI002F957CCD
MLRSLYAGISGLRAEQTMLDVTSNNIANVNTTGFKSSSVQFEDTLSQTLSAAGLPQPTKAGTNPNQVGLGVRVAAITTNLAQGEQQSTGNNLDTMISGDGYFVTTIGTQTQYTRDGAFHWDAQGRLASADGGLVKGWSAVGGVINTGGAPSPISLPSGSVAPAVATTKAVVTGNLDSTGAGGQSVKEISVYAADGTRKTLSITFTPGANGAWSYSAGDGSGAPVTGTVQCANGAVTGATKFTTSDGITIDMSGLTGFADLSTATIATQDGTAAGRLLSTSMGNDGTLSGTFSNGATIPLARLALATFVNPEGLAKAGNSTLQETLNSGSPTLTTAGEGSAGTIVAGALEASNVDLSQEFTNLIIAQRGFQANARIITTSDQVLQELVQLKQ